MLCCITLCHTVAACAGRRYHCIICSVARCQYDLCGTVQADGEAALRYVSKQPTVLWPICLNKLAFQQPFEADTVIIPADVDLVSDLPFSPFLPLPPIYCLM